MNITKVVREPVEEVPVDIVETADKIFIVADLVVIQGFICPKTN